MRARNSISCFVGRSVRWSVGPFVACSSEYATFSNRPFLYTVSNLFQKSDWKTIQSLSVWSWASAPMSSYKSGLDCAEFLNGKGHKSWFVIGDLWLRIEMMNGRTNSTIRVVAPVLKKTYLFFCGDRCRKRQRGVRSQLSLTEQWSPKQAVAVPVRRLALW